MPNFSDELVKKILNVLGNHMFTYDEEESYNNEDVIGLIDEIESELDQQKGD